MKVDFLNLKRQYAEIASELEEAVVECLRSGAYIEGPKVKELEEKLAEPRRFPRNHMRQRNRRS